MSNITLNKPERIAHRILQAAEKLEDAKHLCSAAGRADLALEADELIDAIGRFHAKVTSSGGDTQTFKRKAA